MNDHEISGYDAAQRLRRDDDLGRWRFASEIAEVIRSTPADWSARIGIFGKWGEGKSTILHFLEGILKPEGNIMFCFNPWAVRNLNELWADFGIRLLEALAAADLIVEPRWKGAVRKLQRSFTSSGLADLGEGAADLFGKGKLFKGAFGLVESWLRPDGPQVKKIRESLGKRRVIVFVDDLDRAAPELLPKLLLSLREILDLPGFTFVLAFDNEIVAEGLVTANKAWGDGFDFLDKILDFRYYLPPVSKEGKRLLLGSMLRRYCDFVPEASIAPIEHLLPDNPRKLKVLVRSLISLKPQMARHGTDELNWMEIWLAEMVRQESYPFFMRLLENDTLDDLAGIGYRMKRSGARRGLGRDVDVDNADIEELINKVGGINKAQSERLVQLINATRMLSSFNLRYNWRFAVRPEALTWKEFRAILARWEEVQLPETLSAWIGEHSSCNSIDRADAENDLFETMLNAKHNEESEAANSPTVDENASHCAKAGLILKMTEQFLRLPNMFTADRFRKLYEKSTYWIAFRANQADADLRAAEEQALQSLLERSSDDQAPALLQALEPWDTWAFMAEDAEAAKLKKELRGSCVKQILPKVERAFVASLKQPECIRRLGDAQNSMAFVYLLFSRDCLPWGSVVRGALLDLIGRAKSDPIEYEKVNDLLHLLVEVGQNKSSYIERESAVRIVADEEFVAALWRGVTSRHIQFRMLKSYLFSRNILVAMGVQEDILRLTPELEAANRPAQANAVTPANTEPTT